MRSLRGSSDTRATGTNDDHVIGAFDGFLRFIGKGLRTGLQGSDVAAGLLRSIVYGIKHSAAGKGCTGHAVHTGGSVFHDLREQDIVRHVAHMLRLGRRYHFNARNGIFGERHAQYNVTIIAGSSSLIGARHKGNLGCLRCFTLRGSQCAGHSRLHGFAGDGCAGNAIHGIGIRLAHVCLGKLLDGRTAQRRRLP